MRQFLFSYYSGPVIGLGIVLAIACLACSWYINRLQEDLARTVRQDAASVEAAVDLQVQLRHLRVHSLVLAAEETDARRAVVNGDLARVATALTAIRETATTPEDAQLAEKIVHDYARYKENLGLDRLPPSGSAADVARWSDAHHMSDLIDICRALVERQQERMKDGLERSENQSAWAGRILLGLGIGGVFAGVLSGYATARTLTRRVAQLSVRVQAVQAHLEQDVGAMTVKSPPDFEDLDAQLDRVVQRVSDVCQRFQAQERDLLRAEQLAAVGQLAAGVAHEIRNPLTGVKLLLQAAIRPSDATALTPERVQRLLQEIARIERTVQGLMDFATAPPPDRRPHELRTLLADAVDLAQTRAELKSVTIRPVASGDPFHVAVDRDQFLSLLTNLLFNAIDAAPAGGEVGVSAVKGEDDKIRVAVTDTGAGIDDAVAGKLFTAFATTKPSGTGLGLTIAGRIAHEHGGTLTAANRPGGGACFLLTLPGAEVTHADSADH